LRLRYKILISLSNCRSYGRSCGLVFDKFEFKSLTNQVVKNEYNRIKKRLVEGIHPMDINKKSVAVSNNKVLIKGAAGRYVVQVSDTHVDILGLSYRGYRFKLY